MPADWNRRRARWDEWKRKVNAELAKHGLKYAEGEIAKMTAKRVKVTVDGREQDVPAVPIARGLKEALGLDEGRPWGRGPGAEWDEDERKDAQLRAMWKKRDAQKKPEPKHEPKPSEPEKHKGHESGGGSVDEVAPPGFEKAVKAMKKDKGVDNPFAVAWAMKKKGYKPSDDVDEMDASQPYAPTSMADGNSEVCEACGMAEGHKPGCPLMAEADPADRDDTSCPECGAPHGMKHDKGCPIGRDEEEGPEHMGGLTRRERYYETTDFDGLPIDEAGMFDRFDTLVGHRFDGTFDERKDESARLKDLVKRVVREAWSTYNPKTGEETEHSNDDDDIKDLFTHKDKDKGVKKEMKLGVAGRFDGAYEPDDMDDDEDYKVLEPKKAPEPEQSGVRAKPKAKKKKS